MKAHPEAGYPFKINKTDNFCPIFPTLSDYKDFDGIPSIDDAVCSFLPKCEQRGQLICGKFDNAACCA